MFRNKSIRTKQYILDKTGMWTSVMCAAHCIAVPMMASISVFSSAAFIYDERVENIVLLISVLIATSSLLPAYIRLHQRMLPIVVLFTGFLLIGLSRFLVEVNEPALASTGALLIASAHFLNYRYCKKIS